MGTDLKKQTSLDKFGVVACLGGGVAAGFLLTWWLGVPLMLLSVYFFARMMKHMAESGQRFHS